MTHKDKIAVIGAGSWGTAVANVFSDSGYPTTIWGRDPAVVDSINHQHENAKYLKGFRLSESLKATTHFEELLDKASIIVNGVPTQQIRNVFYPVKSHLKKKIIINTAKGIEQKTHRRVSEIFKHLNPHAKYCVLSGPSFAQEVCKRLPTLVTVASESRSVAKKVQLMISNSYFRAYTSHDVVGVEYAGALKNVVAIAAGLVTGLELGYNATAAVINRGVAEILRISRKERSNPMTFLGLAGMGDLILTCTGPLSRNRRVGVLLGQGKKLEEIQRELGGVAEGVYTAQSAYELAKEFKIEMPITEEIYKILYKHSTPQAALKHLMSRDLTKEW